MKNPSHPVIEAQAKELYREGFLAQQPPVREDRVDELVRNNFDKVVRLFAIQGERLLGSLGFVPFCSFPIPEGMSPDELEGREDLPFVPSERKILLPYVYGVQVQREVRGSMLLGLLASGLVRFLGDVFHRSTTLVVTAFSSEQRALVESVGQNVVAPGRLLQLSPFFPCVAGDYVRPASVAYFGARAHDIIRPESRALSEGSEVDLAIMLPPCFDMTDSSMPVHRQPFASPLRADLVQLLQQLDEPQGNGGDVPLLLGGFNDEEDGERS